MQPPLVVRNNIDSRLYDGLSGDDVVGTISYELSGNRVVFSHTFVDPKHRGRGFATELVRQALDDVRASGKKVTAYCGFVADFLARHEEYQELVDPDHPVSAEHR